MILNIIVLIINATFTVIHQVYVMVMKLINFHVIWMNFRFAKIVKMLQIYVNAKNIVYTRMENVSQFYVRISLMKMNVKH